MDGEHKSTAGRQRPQTGMPQALPDPHLQAVASTFDPHKTKLFLAGEDPVTPMLYSEHTIALQPLASSSAPTASIPGNTLPAPAPPGALSAVPTYAPSMAVRSGQRLKPLWWIVAFGGVACIAFLLGTMVPALSYLAAPNSVSKAPPQGPISTPALPTATAARYPGLGVNPGMTISPALFNVRSDCEFDNGYRCTATLTASPNDPGSIDWYATSHLMVQFSPTDGTLAPGEQQQVIIYISNSCPYKGTISFLSDGSEEALSLPVSCQGFHSRSERTRH